MTGNSFMPGLFSLITERMRYLSERQRVIASNISNSDTPGYIAKDLDDNGFKTLLEKKTGKLSLVETRKGHLSSSLPAQTYKVVEAPSPYETKYNKNSVVIEEQLIKSSKVFVDYSMASQLYRKYIDMFKASMPKI